MNSVDKTPTISVVKKQPKTYFYLVVIAAALVLTVAVMILSRSAVRQPVNTDKLASEPVTWTPFSELFETDLRQWETRQGAELSTAMKRTGEKSLKLATGDDQNAQAFVSHTFSQLHNRSKPYVFLYDDGQISSENKYIYFEVGNPATGKKISVGIQTDKNTYVYCPSGDRNLCIDTRIVRTPGWHRLIFFVTPKGTYAKIDSRILADLPSVLNRSDLPALNPDITASLNIKLGAAGRNIGAYFDDLGEYVVEDMPDLRGVLNKFRGIYLSIYGNIDRLYVQRLAQQILALHSRYCTVPEFPCPAGSRRSFNGVEYEYYEGQRNRLVTSLKYLSVQLRAAGENGKADIIDQVLVEQRLAKSDDRYIALDGQRSPEVLAATTLSGTDSTEKEINEVEIQVEKENLTSPDTVLPTEAAREIIPESERPKSATNYSGIFNPGGPWYCNRSVPYSEYIGNSSGEENSWPAITLFNAYIRGTDDNGNPLTQDQKDDMLAQVKLFALHVFSRDDTTGRVTTPLRTYQPFTSRTIYDDFLMDNHLFHPHPTYAFSTVMDMLGMTYTYRRTFGADLDETKNNVLNVYRKAQEYVDYRTFQYKGNRISRNQRDRNGNDRSDFGALNPEQDPTCQNPPSRYPNDGTQWPGNVFRETGRGDWGEDALFRRLKMYALVKDVYGANSFTDAETGFSTADLSRHALEFLNYIHNEYLWRWEQPQLQITSIEIPKHDLVNDPVYRWWRNGQVLEDLTAYIDVTENPSQSSSPAPSPSPTVTLQPSTPQPTLTGALTPTPIITYSPGIHIKAPKCINENATGELVFISWGSLPFKPAWVDITGKVYFFQGFHSKYISGQNSTAAPAGFSGGFKLQPDTLYKVRLRAGLRTSAAVSFRVPACQPDVN